MFGHVQNIITGNLTMQFFKGATEVTNTGNKF